MALKSMEQMGIRNGWCSKWRNRWPTTTTKNHLIKESTQSKQLHSTLNFSLSITSLTTNAMKKYTSAPNPERWLEPLTRLWWSFPSSPNLLHVTCPRPSDCQPSLLPVLHCVNTTWRIPASIHRLSTQVSFSPWIQRNIETTTEPLLALSLSTVFLMCLSRSHITPPLATLQWETFVLLHERRKEAKNGNSKNGRETFGPPCCWRDCHSNLTNPTTTLIPIHIITHTCLHLSRKSPHIPPLMLHSQVEKVSHSIITLTILTHASQRKSPSHAALGGEREIHTLSTCYLIQGLLASSLVTKQASNQDRQTRHKHRNLSLKIPPLTYYDIFPHFAPLWYEIPTLCVWHFHTPFYQSESFTKLIHIISPSQTITTYIHAGKK